MKNPTVVKPLAVSSFSIVAGAFPENLAAFPIDGDGGLGRVINEAKIHTE